MLQRSTKGASKQRRDWINSEINVIREHLPVGENVQRRLSQLQVMALCNSYIAKTNCFHNALSVSSGRETFDFNKKFDFTEALPGFLMAITTEGRLLYVSENVTEYLGHSMVDLMTQAESVYDIIDAGDHSTLKDFFMSKMTRFGDVTSGSGLQAELDFTCRMNLGNIFRRSNILDRQKIMKIRGRMMWPEGYLNLAEPIFVARCSSVLSCSSHDNAATNDTMMYHTSHSIDMKFTNIESNGEFHLGYSHGELRQQSWYQLIHPDDVFDAVRKHQELTRSGFDTSKSVCVRVQTKYGHFIWLHIIMRITTPVGVDSAQQEITCLNHVISEKDALETRSRESWEEMASLLNGNAMDVNQLQGQAFLPTVVVNEGFLEDTKAEAFTKPVDCNRQELMKKLRNKAQEKGNSKAKRAKQDIEFSSHESRSGSGSSGNSNDSTFSAAYLNQNNNNINYFADSHTHSQNQQEPPQYTSTAQQYQLAFGSDLLYSDIVLHGPLTPAYSVASGVQEDCMTYVSDDNAISSLTPSVSSFQRAAEFNTPPYSPQSDADESQPIYGQDERSFFDSVPPMYKARSASPIKHELHAESQFYLPELPCDDVAQFLDSVECRKTMAESTYIDLIDSPFFFQTIEMMSSVKYSQ